MILLKGIARESIVPVMFLFIVVFFFSVFFLLLVYGHGKEAD